MNIEIVTTKSKPEIFARYLLLFVLVSSFFTPAWMYISEDNIGYTDVVFYKNVDTLWKMVIFLCIATAFLSCCHSKVSWLIVAPFIPFLVWLLISAVFNGLCLRMVRSFGSLLTPILFAAAFGTLFRFPQDIYLVKRACLWSIFIGFVYGLSFRILSIPVFEYTLGNYSLGSYIFVYNRVPLCACSIAAGAITAVELRKNIYDRKKIILFSFLFLIPVLSGGRIYLVGGIFAHVWLFFKIFRQDAVRHLAILIPALILGLVLTWGGYYEKTFGDSTVQISEIRTSGRLTVWPEYWQLVTEKPFLGHGPGGDIAYAQEYRWGLAMGSAHSDYLGLLIYGGWLALIMYLLAWCRWCVLVYRLSVIDRSHSQWYSASLMPIMFFLIAATVSNVLRAISVMCPLIALISMAIGHLYRQQAIFRNVSRTTVRHMS